MQTTRTDVAIDLPGVDEPARGVLVRPGPDQHGPWPGVVMLHEIWGLDEEVCRQADRLAANGYLVLVPDLLGEGNRLRCMISALRSMQSGRGRAYPVIAACRGVLRTASNCTGRIGVIGFCMGGGFALMCVNDGFDAASINYGMLPKDLDAALVGACPVVASYGLVDKSLAGAARDLGEALTRAEVPHDVKEYPGAGHAFMNETMNGPRALRPIARVTGIGPNPDAAADAWRRIERFFGHFLADR